MLAQRVFITEEEARKTVIDDDDSGKPAGRVLPVEVAPSQQLYPEGGEEPGRYRLGSRGGLFVRRALRTGDLNLALSQRRIASERKRTGVSGRLHARQRRHALAQLLIETHPLIDFVTIQDGR